MQSQQKEDEERKVPDIDSKDHYSIELEKQQAEYDKMMKLAEERKMDVRRTIAKLRRQFKKLLEKNQELPSNLQLQRKVCLIIEILPFLPPPHLFTFCNLAKVTKIIQMSSRKHLQLWR